MLSGSAVCEKLTDSIFRWAAMIKMKKHVSFLFLCFITECANVTNKTCPYHYIVNHFQWKLTDRLFLMNGMTRIELLIACHKACNSPPCWINTVKINITNFLAFLSLCSYFTQFIYIQQKQKWTQNTALRDSYSDIFWLRILDIGVIYYFRSANNSASVRS